MRCRRRTSRAAPPDRDEHPEGHGAASVAKKPRTRLRAAATGTTISALTSSRPTVRMASVTVTAARTHDQQVVEPHRQALDPGELLVGADREELRGQPEGRHQHDDGEHADQHQVARGDRGERAEQVLRQRTGAGPGDAGHQHAGRQPAVEQDGQPDVAGGLAELPQQLDGDRAGDAGRHGDRDRRLPGQQGQADAGDGDVAEAVAEQAEPALHDVGPDRRARSDR